MTGVQTCALPISFVAEAGGEGVGGDVGLATSSMARSETKKNASMGSQVSTGDFEEALAFLLGMDAGGLSTSTIARLARFAAIRQSDRVYGRDR